MNEPRFTVAEIRRWLERHLMRDATGLNTIPDNIALRFAMTQLEDTKFGLDACVRAWSKKKQQMSFDNRMAKV